MTTAKLFNLGNSQAVRIPARYRMQVDEVEIFQRGDELVLKPKARSAADIFARARAQAGMALDLCRPEQGEHTPAPNLD